MALVVDASVAVKWLVVEAGSADAHDLFDDSGELHAPRLLVSEVANAVWRKVRLGQVDSRAAGPLLATMSDMPVRWHADEAICADAIRLAITHDRPVYDFMYLALAQRLGTRVVTADKRFVNALAMTAHAALVVPLKYSAGNS